MRKIHRITIKQDTSTDSQVDPSYSDVITKVPCNIIPVSGGEEYRGKQLQSETNNVIELRYYANLLPNMIAVNEFDSTEYLIKKITTHGGRKKELLIEVVEVVA